MDNILIPLLSIVILTILVLMGIIKTIKDIKTDRKIKDIGNKLIVIYNRLKNVNLP